MSDTHPDAVGTVDNIAMIAGGLAFLIGMVVWPPLIALGLAIWGLYVLYELATPGSLAAGEGPTD